MENNNQLLQSEVMEKSQIKSALRKSFSDVVHLIHHFDEEVYTEPKEEGKWTPEEILGHLWLSTVPVVKAMSIPKVKLEEKFGKLERDEFEYDDLKSKYYTALEKGVTAPALFVFSQKGELSKDQLIQKFTTSLDHLLTELDKWSEDDLSCHVIPHPAIGVLSMREMLYSTHFHTIHHYNQMVDIKE